MKTDPTTASPPDGIACFECEAGRLLPVVEDYLTSVASLGEVRIPAVQMLRCDQCGDTVIGDAGNKQIDAWLDKALHAITPGEMQDFLTKYQLTQKQASQITGLGEKNICRWLSGRSRPSESVSNFLRLLLSDESAFERLRQKNFSQTAVARYPQEERQPTEEERKILTQVDYAELVKMNAVGDTRSPQEKRTQICRWTRSTDLLDFGSKMEAQAMRMAAYKDTRQKSSNVSRGLWMWLGEEVARNVKTEPYSREKLREAVRHLRNLTTRPLASSANEVQAELARAGVALVFIPTMKESALRGCTRLLTANKALIVHALKYRSLSQFWIILFHEIAHLLLHINEPGEMFADYEKPSDDPREEEADTWSYETLVSRDKELEFTANHRQPEPWQLARYAESISIHPAIAAEILNKRTKEEVISYALLKKQHLFPQLTKEETRALMATSSLRAPFSDE